MWCRNQPRACGTGVIAPPADVAEVESTPRVRDRFPRYVGQVETCGINPARAGQVSSDAFQKRAAGNQPRACGTGRLLDAVRLLQAESTPRVRDRFMPVIQAIIDTGINPARAGQVRALRKVPKGNKNQPRACGTGSCIILRSCPAQRPAIFDSFTVESAASAHRYQDSRLQPKSATIFSTDTNHIRLKPIPADACHSGFCYAGQHQWR